MPQPSVPLSAVLAAIAATALATSWTAVAPTARANERIAVQARLTQDGVPLHTDLADVTFQVLDAASGGTLLWEESHGVVSIRNGILSVELGATDTLAGVFDGGERWVAIVQNAAEIAPRIRLAAVPHALWAQRADAAAVASGLWSGSGTVTFASLAGTGLEVDGTALRVGQGFGLVVSGGTVAVDTSALVGAGTDTLAGDALRVSYTPSNYVASAANLAGHLEGIDTALPFGGGGGGVGVYQVHTAVALTSSGDGQAIVLPAGALSADGDAAEVFGWFSLNANTACNVIVQFGSTQLLNHHFPHTQGNGYFQARVVRTGSTSQKAFLAMRLWGHEAINQAWPTEDCSGAITIKARADPLSYGTVNFECLSVRILRP